MGVMKFPPLAIVHNFRAVARMWQETVWADGVGRSPAALTQWSS